MKYSKYTREQCTLALNILKNNNYCEFFLVDYVPTSKFLFGEWEVYS